MPFARAEVGVLIARDGPTGKRESARAEAVALPRRRPVHRPSRSRAFETIETVSMPWIS